MKKFLFILVAFLASWSSQAEEKLQVFSGGKVAFESYVSSIKDVRFAGASAVFYLEDSNYSIPFAEIDSMVFVVDPILSEELIYIGYSADSVTVVNPYSSQGVSVQTTGGQVIVTIGSGISNATVKATGQTTNGSLRINSAIPFNLLLSNLDLTNVSAQAINLNKDVAAQVILEGTNKIADSSTNEKNNAFTSAGDVTFSGTGSLTLVANKKNALSSDKTLTINGGTLTASTAIEDGKAIKCDGNMTINGGTLNITASGKQSKGLSTNTHFTFNGGVCTILASGTTALSVLGSGYDTSYCSGIKADSNVYITGGSLAITLPATNQGGKGISADGNLSITGGNITVSTAGAGASYTNISGVKDSYSSCCIKSNGSMEILGGTITCSSSGSGGKGIAADGALVIGQVGANNTNLVMDVKTSGERFSVSSSDYCNPKAIKSEANLTVNSGTITVTCSQTGEGGEGMESEGTFTANGGKIQIETYDDCINASSHIQINAGEIYCKSTGNDAIDSNGTLTIAGGLVIANGTSSPEAGFDCDQKTFTISGGTIIGTGGSSSTPTTSSAKQPTIMYSNATPGNAICIKNPDGEIVLLYELPTFTTSSSGGGNQGGGGGNQGGGGGNSGSSSMVVLFSDPNLVVNSSKNYTLLSGGTISGGTTVNGYNTGGTYSGETTTRTFTLNANYKTVQ